MTETKTPPSTTTKPAARAGKPTAAGKSASRNPPPARNPAADFVPKVADRATDLSDELLKAVESGQRAAVESVRKFLDAVEQALPRHGAAPSKRQDVVDSAMEMADRLIHTQYEFIRKVVDSAGKSLGAADGDKPAGAKRDGATKRNGVGSRAAK